MRSGTLKIEDHDLGAIRDIVRDGLGGLRARIFLFGSAARREIVLGSDVDVGVPFEGDPQPDVLSVMRDELEESNIPYRVDLVNLNTAGKGFREAVLQEGVEWTD